tara:strand:+ start:742 stop:1893 length:1152 start_codon:yes stop_codon:yes gene_type:complete
MPSSSAISAGDTVLATQYNDLRTDALHSHVSGKLTSVYTTSELSLSSSGGSVDVQFDGEVVDEGTLVDIATTSGTPPTNSKIAISTAGTYLINVVSGEVAANPTTESVTLEVYKDNSLHSAGNTGLYGYTLRFQGDSGAASDVGASARLWVPASEWYDGVAPPSALSYENTGGTIYQYRDFDPNAVEDLQYNLRFPLWSGNVPSVSSYLTAALYWTGSDTTSGNVRWGMGATAVNVGSTVGAYPATSPSNGITSAGEKSDSNDTGGVADINIARIGDELTSGGSTYNGIPFQVAMSSTRLCFVKLYRNSTDPDDTYNNNARFIGAEFEFRNNIEHQHANRLQDSFVYNHTSGTTYFHFKVNATSSDAVNIGRIRCDVTMLEDS